LRHRSFDCDSITKESRRIGTLTAAAFYPDLVSPADRKFQQFFGRFRANLNLGKFYPFAAFIYSQHGFGRDLAQGKAPTYSLIMVQEFHVAFEKAAIIEGTHVISCIFVIEGDHPEGLQNSAPVRFCPPNSFDDQYQAIEPILCFFTLMQIQRFTGTAHQTGLPIPFPDQKFQLLHRSTLRVEVRNSGQVSHLKNEYYH
jgi:hypothetical protein